MLWNAAAGCRFGCLVGRWRGCTQKIQSGVKLPRSIHPKRFRDAALWGNFTVLLVFDLFPREEEEQVRAQAAEERVLALVVILDGRALGEEGVPVRAAGRARQVRDALGVCGGAGPLGHDGVEGRLVRVVRRETADENVVA